MNCTRKSSLSLCLLLLGATGFFFDSVTADPLDHWTRTNVGSPVLLRGVACGNGRFVAVGDGGAIFHSVDGLAWSRAQSSAIGSLRAVTFGNSRFVAVEGASYESGIQQILTSTDGTNWIRGFSDFRLINVAFGRGIFIGTSDLNVVGTSADGAHWGWEIVNADPFGIGIGDPLYLVAGSRTFTSASGSNWVGGVFTTNLRPGSIAYGNGTFLGVGLVTSSPAIPCTTVDGSEWTRWQAPGPAFRWGTVTFAHDTFVMSGDSGVILTSTTGTNWIERVPGQFYDAPLAFTAYAQGRVIIVGVNGVVLVSDHYGPPIVKISSSSGLPLKVSAVKDKLCIVEQSNDLINWTELTRYTNFTETAEISVGNSSNSAAIFRVVTD